MVWWLDAPFALALHSYHQMQEIDRRRDWVARLARQDAAELIMLAFHEPKQLRDERQRILASAAGQGARAADAAARERGLALARRLRRALSRSG